MRNKRIKNILLATVVIAPLTFAITPLADAKAGGSSLCPSNKVCVYDHHYWVGLLAYRAPGQGIQNLASGAQKKMTSWENKTGTHARWYAGYNSNGGCYSMKLNDNTHNVGEGANDKMVSWATDYNCKGRKSGSEG